MIEQHAVSNYYKIVRGNPPRATTMFGLEQAKARGVLSADTAVDLGCGEGRDLAAMLNLPWTVWAIDKQPEAIELVKERFSDSLHTRLHPLVADLAQLALPKNRFVNASFSLPFVDQVEFPEVWTTIRSSLLPDGIFAGQLFGEKDEGWPYLDKFTRIPKSQIPELLSDFEILRFEEMNEPGQDASGHRKHWHIFHIVARKKY